MSDPRRDQGQFFTPLPLCRLAAAAAGIEPGQRVLDPSCGDGRMLQAAAERLGPQGAVHGIEIDPAVADAARRRQPRANVVTASAFEATAAPGWKGDFDAVIGNPPYVRYSVAARSIAAAGGPVFEAVRAAKPRLSPTQLAQRALRACLVGGDPKRALAWLEQPDAAPTSHRPWVQLIASLGARSDLSVPVWLLAIQALRPGGRLAFVAADSPLSRSYGLWLRYAWLRWAKPELVVLPGNAGWFPDAQVPVSLRVMRRRDPQDCGPISQRDHTDTLRVVTLEPSVQLHSDAGLAALAGGDGAPRDQAARALGRLWTDNGPWRSREISHGQLAQSLLAELQRTEPDALAALEGRQRVRVVQNPGLVAATPSVRWRRLTQLGVQPRQGLRTGFNPFFYAERVAPGRVRLSPELGSEELNIPDTWLRPALRYQRELLGSSLAALPVRWLLLATGTAVHPLDVAAYPAAWVEHWRTTGVRLLPPGVQRWIALGRAHSVMRHGVAVPVPAMSAVAPNTKTPPIPQQPCGPAPAPPRGFYRLPIATRHHAPLLLGRLVHQRPRPALNLEGRLIDANFSTLEIEPGVDPHALLALLSSTPAWAAFEQAGTPMGGGALKLEAAHLREVWLPEGLQDPRMAALGHRLAQAPAHEHPDIVQLIDRALVPNAAELAGLSRRALDARQARQERSSSRVPRG